MKIDLKTLKQVDNHRTYKRGKPWIAFRIRTSRLDMGSGARALCNATPGDKFYILQNKDMEKSNEGFYLVPEDTMLSSSRDSIDDLPAPLELKKLGSNYTFWVYGLIKYLRLAEFNQPSVYYMLQTEESTDGPVYACTLQNPNADT